MYVQFIPSWLERDAQACRRGFLRGFARAEQDDESAACLRSDRKPAQFLVSRMAEPSDQGVAGPGAQHLLRRPQGIAPAGRAHYGEMGQVDPCGGQGGGIGQMRWRQPYDALSRGGEPGQRGQDELQLANSFLQAQHLGEGGGGPSAARQVPVELCITRGNRWGNRAERLTAPDGVPLQEGFEV